VKYVAIRRYAAGDRWNNVNASNLSSSIQQRRRGAWSALRNWQAKKFSADFFKYLDAVWITSSLDIRFCVGRFKDLTTARYLKSVDEHCAAVDVVALQAAVASDCHVYFVSSLYDQLQLQVLNHRWMELSSVV
jgi:hypothetical protein